jgi:hypothetical protein
VASPDASPSSSSTSTLSAGKSPLRFLDDIESGSDQTKPARTRRTRRQPASLSAVPAGVQSTLDARVNIVPLLDAVTESGTRRSESKGTKGRTKGRTKGTVLPVLPVLVVLYSLLYSTVSLLILEFLILMAFLQLFNKLDCSYFPPFFLACAFWISQSFE